MPNRVRLSAQSSLPDGTCAPNLMGIRRRRAMTVQILEHLRSAHTTAVSAACCCSRPSSSKPAFTSMRSQACLRKLLPSQLRLRDAACAQQLLSAMSSSAQLVHVHADPLSAHVVIFVPTSASKDSCLHKRHTALSSMLHGVAAWSLHVYRRLVALHDVKNHVQTA